MGSRLGSCVQPLAAHVNTAGMTRDSVVTKGQRLRETAVLEVLSPEPVHFCGVQLYQPGCMYEAESQGPATADISAKPHTVKVRSAIAQ